jgi:hypothetical protein
MLAGGRSNGDIGKARSVTAAARQISQGARNLSGRAVEGQRRAERGYELSSCDADCHLTRPQSDHAPLQSGKGYHASNWRYVTSFTVVRWRKGLLLFRGAKRSLLALHVTCRKAAIR